MKYTGIQVFTSPSRDVTIHVASLAYSRERWRALQTSAMSKPVDRSIQDLALLTNELHEVTDPHTLGIKLGIQSSDVTQILQDARGTTEREKTGILDHWLKNDRNASWATLVKVLKQMNHGVLAEKLAKRYCNEGGMYTS